MEMVPKKITPEKRDDIYKYLNFHQVSADELTNLVHS